MSKHSRAQRVPHPSATYWPKGRNKSLLVISADHVAKRSEYRTLVDARSTGARCGREDPVSEAAEGKRLQPDTAWAGQRIEEQSLATEQCVLEAADELDVITYAGLERDQASGVHAQAFTRFQRAFDDRAPGMHERQSVSGEPLQDE